MDSSDDDDLEEDLVPQDVIGMIQNFLLLLISELVEAQENKERKTIIIRSPVSSETYKLNSTNGIKFARHLRGISQIYRLLMSNAIANKRDLYYEFKRLYIVQRNVDHVVSKACRFFQISRRQLNIGNTPKGFAFGKLRIESQEKTLDFDAIPLAIVDNMCEFEHVFVDAEAILVVEKDTVFQRLVNEGFEKVLPNVLLVTGRGFPDFATRCFLRWLVDLCNLPIYVLVDYDPYGLHIYYNYRYGCQRTRIESENLRLDEAVFLGLKLEHFQYDEELLPADQLLTMGEKDQKRLKLLRTLAKEENDEVLLKEVETMEQLKLKFEIEALHSIDPSFLLHYYLKPFFDIYL